MYKSSKNKNGLTRKIPPEIKRQIRERDGFGCVFCGTAIVQYEHIEPEFKNATEHDPNRMALLCPTCHDRVTKKIWPKSSVFDAIKDPACKKTGYTSDAFLFKEKPQVILGNARIFDCPTPLEIGGHKIITIEDPEVEGGPFLLSGVFTNKLGEVTLTIHKNEWKAYTRNWDLEIEGSVIKVREGKRKPCLILRVDHPSIYVDRLEMAIGPAKVSASTTKLTVRSGKTFADLTGSDFSGCKIGISLGF